jgi:FkbM family methyltransferase
MAIKVNYFDLGLYRGTELWWIVRDIFPRLKIKDYDAYGFEACAKYANELKRQFADNQKVNILNRAISKSGQDIKLYHATNNVGHSIFNTKKNVDKDSYEIVKGVKFSDWVLNNVDDFKSSFNILKVNIEGAEWHLFNDLCETGLNEYIHIFCGQGHDVEKVGELQDKVKEYYNLIEKNNIKLYRFTEWKAHKNNLTDTVIKQKIVEFYKNNYENI